MILDAFEKDNAPVKANGEGSSTYRDANIVHETTSQSEKDEYDNVPTPQSEKNQDDNESTPHSEHNKENNSAAQSASTQFEQTAFNLFDEPAESSEIEEELKHLNISMMTPVEALVKLSELQNRLK